MPRFELKQFGNPDFLRRVRPETLRELLAPHASFLTRHGLSLPNGACSDELIDQLASILVSVPDELPPELFETLEMLDALTSTSGWLELQAAAPAQVAGLLQTGDGPADVALRLWREQPQIVERIFAKLRLRARRTLTCYRPQTPSKPQAATPALCKAMEADLSREFSDLLSSAACDISVFHEPQGQTFLIRHGEPLKRLGVYDDCGRAQTKVVRPIKHDVAHVNTETGEFQVSGVGGPLQETYRSIFSSHLFADANTLQRSRCYTLDPIREGSDCLDCIELPTVAGVRLRSLQIRRLAGTNRNTIEGDVFEEIKSNGWDGLSDFALERAQFQLRLRDKRRALIIELAPGRDTVGGDGAAPIAQEWMQRRGFVCDHELEDVLADR